MGLDAGHGEALAARKRAVSGGARVERSSPSFVRCAFEDNTGRNGLEATLESAATLVDCVFRANDGEPGGAFVAGEGASVSLLGCTIEANGADDGGGGFAVSGAEVTLAACRIAGNFGDHAGGAFECDRGSVRLENCLLEANHGDGAGGAFSAFAWEVLLVHCTLAGNAQLPGGPLTDAVDTVISVRGCVVWGNEGDVVRLAGGSRLEASFSCVQGAAPLPGEGNRNEDPLFVEAGSYDFSVVSYRPSFILEAGDYRLRAGSPCIDIVPGGGAPPLDLDGAARPCGAGADAGAFEIGGCRPPQFVRGDVDASGSLNLADPIQILDVLFRGGAAPGCLDAGDVDDDGRTLLNDPIYLLGFLLLGARPPPELFAGCGPDRTSMASRAGAPQPARSCSARFPVGAESGRKCPEHLP